VDERCTGESEYCPRDTFKAEGALCRPADGPCDAPETCTGSTNVCPADEVKLVGEICRPAIEGGCDVAEVCDGSTKTCPADVVMNTTVMCRPVALGGLCDVAEYCDGEGECPKDKFAPKHTLCRNVTGLCDKAEECHGDSAFCPENKYRHEGRVCREPAGPCDAPEECTGDDPDCPPDQNQPAGFLCHDTDNCTEVSTCSSTGVCSGESVCNCAADIDCNDGNPCTTDRCEFPGKCVYTPASSMIMCRSATGPCDVDEYCTGEDLECPVDSVATVGAICRPVWGICDVAEYCDGHSKACPTDALRPKGATCRAANGACDVAEQCSGESADCPADAVLPVETLCRSSDGFCDVPEYCDGLTPRCPTNEFRDREVECRGSKGPCDIPETCTGFSPLCPADNLADSSVMCRPTLCEDQTACCDVPEFCSGFSATCPPDELADAADVCRPAVASCDRPEICDGVNRECPPDIFQPDGAMCRGEVGTCDKPEYCDGTRPTCPDDERRGPETVCRPQYGVCDEADVCNGYDVHCPATNAFKGPDVVCRDAVSICDKEERCTGVGPDCPPNAVSTDLWVRCRVALGPCDVDEYCTGSSPDCPLDAWLPAGAECSPDIELDIPCPSALVSTCAADGECGAERAGCPCEEDAHCYDGNPCSDDVCNTMLGICEYHPAASTTECRPARGNLEFDGEVLVTCDVPEFCDGTTLECPVDRVKPANATCRPALGLCDAAEVCSGDPSDLSCPPDAFLPALTECRPAIYECDVADICTGESRHCPEDRVLPNTVVCRELVSTDPGPFGNNSDSHGCDVVEYCDGVNVRCPPDRFQPRGTLCNVVTGISPECLVDESCDGLGHCIGRSGCECEANEDCAGPGHPVCVTVACEAGRCIDVPVEEGLPCDDGDSCTLGDACTSGHCVGKLTCPGEIRDAEGVLLCSGNGVCCQGVCDCLPRYEGDACETYVDSGPTTTLAPGQTTTSFDDFGVLPTRTIQPDLCPDNPEKSDPGECGCAVGDADGDGVEDCLDFAHNITRHDWAMHIDIYNVSQSDQLVGRLGIPADALSDTNFSAVPLVLYIDHGPNATSFRSDYPNPTAASDVFNFTLVAPDGADYQPFREKVTLCFRLRREVDVEFPEQLCLASLNDTAQWHCEDTVLGALRIAPHGSFLCGHSDHFHHDEPSEHGQHSLWTIMPAEETGDYFERLVTVGKNLVKDLIEATGLSQQAVIALVFGSLACYCCLCCAGCCALRRRRKSRRTRTRRSAKSPSTWFSSTPAFATVGDRRDSDDELDDADAVDMVSRSVSKRGTLSEDDWIRAGQIADVADLSASSSDEDGDFDANGDEDDEVSAALRSLERQRDAAFGSRLARDAAAVHYGELPDAKDKDLGKHRARDLGKEMGRKKKRK
jgi:hypothetical protein